MDAHKEKRRKEVINALNEAQKLAFSPLSFQALSCAIDFGILKEIDENPAKVQDLTKKLNLKKYVIQTLFDVLESVKVVKKDSFGVYYLTKTGQMFLYNEMTRVNFNFVKDVCYSGADELKNSFIYKKPCGLNKIFKDAATIYPYLPILPEEMRQSWYEFDHYYSDNCFDLIYKIAFKDCNKIFDIGGNMGAFEKVCLKNNPNVDITMIDHQKNIALIQDDPELKNCKFFAADVVNENQKFPRMCGKILMSQFLDCFSSEQIVQILKKINSNSSEDTVIYILEPFIDTQKFDAARLSLVHTSLYFTCMANGCSKMYSKKEMEGFVEDAGWKVQEVYSSIGAHDYTMLEVCKK